MTRWLILLICGVMMLGCRAAEDKKQDQKEEKKEEKKEAAAAEKTHEIIMIDDKFQPAKLTIEAGDTIVWVNNGKKTHNASSAAEVPEALAFDTDDIEAGKKSKPIKFTKTGKIPYICAHHEGMDGEVTVKAK